MVCAAIGVLPAAAAGQQQRSSQMVQRLGSSFVAGAPRPFSGKRLEASASSSSQSASRRSVTTMAAKVTGMIKLALPAGKANPAPPVGPALGAKGVNIMQFCKEYNAATQDKAGMIIPVEITVYEDRSFTFILKTPPASVLLKKAAGVQSGSGEPNRKAVGKVTMEQVREIAAIKLPDLNCTSLDAACNTVMGTAKNMGITVEA
ncbi:hypothetical protein D9Q98_004793 [Chlorella vulgaris]|uniref:Large ribosomal subunit protein uL11c n=1 Tax=Chlorella vulgaris TaxID=3077 RepID=A0A9D4TQL4_CHLVU|nr:hypothetical protein D9Q98_004793 [Chlorella vulgaris]